MQKKDPVPFFDGFNSANCDKQIKHTVAEQKREL